MYEYIHTPCLENDQHFLDRISVSVHPPSPLCFEFLLVNVRSLCFEKKVYYTCITCLYNKLITIFFSPNLKASYAFKFDQTPNKKIKK